MQSRLRKNYKRIKTANILMHMDSMILKSGDMISFEAKIINNKPWFQIIHESPFNSSSFYDGSDFDRACEIYGELLLAFQGASGAEKLRKLKPTFENKLRQLEKEKNVSRLEEMYQTLKKKPLFLGMDDF